ncbi:MAG TPA: lipopolysaccharide transport periplasmic protein LptA [Mariprofundaceae bacterium]|nr:lipopolysaccharide transport periplasmic protein LptA [Mariprofundaceae bacterium]
MIFRVLVTSVMLLVPVFASAGPMHITADRMVLNHRTNKVEFSGHVLLTRDDFRLKCDKLIAHYREGQDELEKAEAHGHVDMRQGTAHGEADNALLDQVGGTLTLMGKAYLEQNSGRIEGETITHRMNQNQTSVTPGKDGRTRMILDSEYPQSGAPDPAKQP